MSMATQIFDICRNRSYVGMSLKIRDPTIRRQPRRQIRTRRNSSAFVKQIDLNFKVQLKCSHYHVCEEDNRNTTTFVGDHTSSQHPFATYTLPVSIFKNRDKTFERYLSQQFQMHRDFINIKLVADKIIQHWVKIVEEEEGENNFRVFGKIYSLEITIELLLFQRVYAIELPVTMVPTSDNAMESMLTRVEIEETWMKLGNDESINCVICLEEIISREEEGKNGTLDLVLQMPCLHLFHEECLKKWLKISHYCPTCRFSMPTNN